MIRRTHNILQWLFAIFVLYLLLTRLLISWVQFFPQQFLSSINLVSNVNVEFKDIELEQNWSGFSIDLHKVSAKSKNFVFQADRLNFDFNLFFFVLPSIDYGDSLRLENGAYQIKRATEQQGENNASQIHLEDFQDWNPNIQRLWKKVYLQNFIISEISPGLTVQISELQSLKKAHLSVVSELSLSYLDVLNYEPFNLKATLTPNIWGNIERGDFALSSFQPLQLARVSKLLPKSWQEVLPQGEFIVDLNAKVAKSRFSQLNIKLNTQSLAWKQDSQDLPQSIGLVFDWQRQQQYIEKQNMDWQFSLSSIHIDNAYVDSVSPIRLNFDGSDYIEFDADKFDLEPFEVIIKALMETQLAGDILERAVALNISDLSGRFNWQTLELAKLDIFFSKLDLPVTDFPGMSVRNVRLIKADDKLSLETKSPLWVLSPKIYPKPLKVELPKLFAFGFDAVNHAWSLPQLKIKIDQIPITVNLSQINTDSIDAVFSAQIASMQQLKKYLPYPLMKPKLQNWLKQSLTGGRDINLSGEVRGLYKNFPFTENNGNFEINASVKQASLKFNPEWPELTQFNANLTFKPYQLDIRTEQLNLGYGNIGRDILVSIPGLNQKNIKLSMNGRVSSGLNNVIQYLQKSPIAEKTGLSELFSSGATFAGNTQVNLENITVPIHGFENEKETVKGSFKLQNAAIDLNKYLAFRNVSGRFDFNEQALAAKKISFTSMGGDGLLDISTNLKDKFISLNAKGLALKEENPWFKSPLPWKANLDIPLKTDKRQGLKLTALVNVNKAKSKLPEPFNETELKDNKLVINANIDKKATNISYKLNELLDGKLSLQKQKDDFAIESVQLAFGKQGLDASIKNSSFITGDISRLNLQRWLDFYDSLSDDEQEESTGREDVQENEQRLSNLNWIKSTVTIEQLEYLSNRFDNTQLSWLFSEKPLRVNVNSANVSGYAEFTDKELITVDLQKLYIRYKNNEQINKKPVPQVSSCLEKNTAGSNQTVNFSGKNIYIDDREIEELSFQFINNKKLQKLENIKGGFGGGAGRFSGNYLFNKTASQSQFTSKFTSSKVSEVTEFLKIDKGFSGKQAEVSLSLDWNGGLTCFNISETKGKINFELKDGSIEDVEPGLARLIGLLSVESLVRRLKLDVKDLTNKGLVYDNIKGKGDIGNGKVALQKFIMQAPSANAELTGDINLVKEDFDLVAKVTPKVGATIPTIAALAGSANPLAALAVYTIMKILPAVNENLVTYEYTVQGPWADPKIKTKKQPQAIEQEGEEFFP